MYSFSIAASFEATLRGVLQDARCLSILVCGSTRMSQCEKGIMFFGTVHLRSRCLLHYPLAADLCSVWSERLLLARDCPDPASILQPPWKQKTDAQRNQLSWWIKWHRRLACDWECAYLLYFGGDWASRRRVRAETSAHDLARHFIRNHGHFFLNGSLNQIVVVPSVDLLPTTWTTTACSWSMASFFKCKWWSNVLVWAGQINNGWGEGLGGKHSLLANPASDESTQVAVGLYIPCFEANWKSCWQFKTVSRQVQSWQANEAVTACFCPSRFAFPDHIAGLPVWDCISAVFCSVSTTNPACVLCWAGYLRTFQCADMKKDHCLPRRIFLSKKTYVDTTFSKCHMTGFSCSETDDAREADCCTNKNVRGKKRQHADYPYIHTWCSARQLQFFSASVSIFACDGVPSQNQAGSNQACSCCSKGSCRPWANGA